MMWLLVLSSFFVSSLGFGAFLPLYECKSAVQSNPEYLLKVSVDPEQNVARVEISSKSNGGSETFPAVPVSYKINQRGHVLEGAGFKMVIAPLVSGKPRIARGTFSARLRGKIHRGTVTCPASNS